jgi:hypothetical protein
MPFGLLWQPDFDVLKSSVFRLQQALGNNDLPGACINRNHTKIKKRMKISSQEQSVLNRVGFTTLIGYDMGCL